MSPCHSFSGWARSRSLGLWALLFILSGLFGWCAGDPAQTAAWFQSPASPLRPGSLAGPPSLLPAPGRAVVQASFWAAGLVLVAVVGVALLLHWTGGPSSTLGEGHGEDAP